MQPAGDGPVSAGAGGGGRHARRARREWARAGPTNDPLSLLPHLTDRRIHSSSRQGGSGSFRHQGVSKGVPPCKAFISCPVCGFRSPTGFLAGLGSNPSHPFYPAAGVHVVKVLGPGLFASGKLKDGPTCQRFRLGGGPVDHLDPNVGLAWMTPSPKDTPSVFSASPGRGFPPPPPGCRRWNLLDGRVGRSVGHPPLLPPPHSSSFSSSSSFFSPPLVEPWSKKRTRAIRCEGRAEAASPLAFLAELLADGCPPTPPPLPCLDALWPPHFLLGLLAPPAPRPPSAY